MDDFCGGMYVFKPSSLSLSTTFTLQQLKKQLENECKRKLELVSQTSKLCEVINGSQKHGNGRVESRVKNRSAYDLVGANYG